MSVIGRRANRILTSSFCLILAASHAMDASAQEPVPARPTSLPNTVEESAPIAPAVSPGPMGLDACLELGFRHQPSIDAANASLAAAQSGLQGLNRMILPGLLRPDLRVRRQQACQGVQIAAAGVTQAEWETRYAITRNFYTVQYVRAQDKVVTDVLNNLTKARERAQKLFEKPTPETKITKLDIDSIDIQLAIIKGKKAQVENGMLKAMAALREAMGLGADWPLEVAAVDLPAAVTEVAMDKDKSSYKEVFSFDKKELIAAALANRPEIVQASAASRITDLEISAQQMINGYQGQTFAAGADLHAKQVPQGVFNNEYRPGAITIEYPTLLAGRKGDRVNRASDLHQRAIAVVDKTENLISLDVEAQYLKWREAVTEVRELSGIMKTAQELPDGILKLNPGDFTGPAVIQANLTAISVRVQMNDAMHMHALALAGLERATAGAFRVAAPK